MALGKQYQAKVKNAGDVLVGVAQVRVGLPSVRPANYVTGTATVKAAFQVPDSTIKSQPLSDGSGNCNIIVPGTSTITAPTGGSLTASGTYTGLYDGAFIVRYNGTGYDIFGPDGMQDTATVASVTSGYNMKLGGSSGAASGATITGTITGVATGMTWVVPVWSSAAVNRAQTGIISPYGIFQKDYNSVGGLKGAKFVPKVDETKTLSSGFPETEDARVLTRTSVSISFEALEYSNANLKGLKDMISSAINDTTTAALPVEIVMRTLGNTLVSFWCPSCSLDSFPELAPTNDFSSFNWSLSANKPTEFSAISEGQSAPTVQFNTWQSDANLFTEFAFIH